MTLELSAPTIAQALQGTANRQTVLIPAARAILRVQGGFVPPVCDAPLPERCPPDTRTTCSKTTFRYYWLIGRKNHERKVLSEYVSQFTAQHYRLPAEYLPLPVRVRNFRRDVAPLFGVRALWLKAQMIAAGKLRYPTIKKRHDKGWESRHFFYRERYFKKLRTDDPEAARQLLQSVWETESLHNRRVLLRCLQINLGVVDEPFIRASLAENALHNRKMERDFATGFYDLPASQLHQTFTERARTLLDYDPASNTITLNHDADMLKKSRVGGAYADWRLTLHDLLQIVPPQYWLNAWQIENDMLIDAFDKHETLRVYIKNHYDATLRSGDSDFAKCVFYRLGDRLNRRHILQMLKISAPTTCQHMTIHWLTHSDNSLHANPARYFLSSGKIDYDDEPFIQALLTALHTKLDPLSDRKIQFFLRDLAHHIPLHMIDDFLEAIYSGQIKPMTVKGSRFYEDLCVFMAFRQRVQDALVEKQQ